MLREVFITKYAIPETDRRTPDEFGGFGHFYGYSKELQNLAPEGRTLMCPAAEAVRQQANHPHISFKELMQADLLILMMACLLKDENWYTQMLLYQQDGRPFPLFQKAVVPAHFHGLATLTGISDPKELGVRIRSGLDRLRVGRWTDFFHSFGSFGQWMNLDRIGEPS